MACEATQKLHTRGQKHVTRAAVRSKVLCLQVAKTLLSGYSGCLAIYLNSRRLMSVRVYVSPECRSGYAYTYSTVCQAPGVRKTPRVHSVLCVLILLPFFLRLNRLQGGTEGMWEFIFFSGFRSEVSVVREAITIL